MSDNASPQSDATERADVPDIDSPDEMSDSLSITRREMLASSAGVGLGLGVLGMSAGRSRAGTKAKAAMSTKVSAGHLHAEFTDAADGIHLQSLYDEIGQRELLAEQPGPLWRIAMFDPQTRQRPDQGWEEKEIDGRRPGAELHWQTGTAFLPPVYHLSNKTLSINGDVSELVETPGLPLSEDISVDGGSYTENGTVWWTWDQDHLYFAADLTDDQHVLGRPDRRTWNEDAIQVGITATAP